MHTLFNLVLVIIAAAACWGRDLRVVCFGDSTTAPRQGVLPYCDQIRGPGVETVNRGVRGNTTGDARIRFLADVLALKPDVLIVQFGINDSTVDVWKAPPATTPRVSVTGFRQNLMYFVETLRASNCTVVIMTFNPLAWTPKMRAMYGKPPYDPDSPLGFNAARDPYLKVIRDVARESGIALADVDAAFKAYAGKPGQSIDDLLLDGIHPNTRGHQLVASLLRRLVPRKE